MFYKNIVINKALRQTLSMIKHLTNNKSVNLYIFNQFLDWDWVNYKNQIVSQYRYLTLEGYFNVDYLDKNIYTWSAFINIHYASAKKKIQIF